jgi:hypothetical protein
VTKDLDLFIKADPANVKATYAALASFGAALADITVEDLKDLKRFIRFGRDPVAVDILPGIDGVNFDEAWARRVEGVIDERIGLTVFFISKSDLIASKLAAGRVRDLADVEEIRNAEASAQSLSVEVKSQKPRKTRRLK